MVVAHATSTVIATGNPPGRGSVAPQPIEATSGTISTSHQAGLKEHGPGLAMRLINTPETVVGSRPRWLASLLACVEPL